jgi:hypothetical protein
MPVEKSDIILEEISINQSSTSAMHHMVVFNFKRSLQPQIMEYIMPRVDLEPSHMRKVALKEVTMEKKATKMPQI